MNFRTTLIIIIVLACLAGAYFLFFQESGDLGSVEEKQRIHEVYGLAQEKVWQVSLAFADAAYQPLTLVKNDAGEWQLTQPFPADANGEKLTEMLENLLNKRVKQTLAVTELGQYGLDTPSITVSLWTETSGNSTPTFRFLIGKKAINFSVYAKEESEPHIFLIESSVLDDLTQSPTDLRDRAAVKLNPETVSELRILNPNQTELRCEKVEKTWRMTHPLSAKADSQEIESLFSTLGSLPVATFEADWTGDASAPALEKYGLHLPRLSVILKDENGTRGLHIGAGTYVKPAHRNAVYTLADDIYAQLNKSVFDLRDKRVLDFQRTATTRIEIESTDGYGNPSLQRQGNAKVVCVKNFDDTWDLKTPIQTKADAQVIDALLFGVDSLKAVEFVTDSPTTLGLYGLAPPAMQVSFTQRGEENPAVLLIGDWKDDAVYVKSGDSSQVSLVNRALIDNIANGVAWLRDKQILNFGIDDVNRFALKYDDVSLRCQRLGTSWRLTAPVQEDANNAEINAILYELEDLRVEEFLSDVPDATKIGLNPPRMQLSLGFRNGKSSVVQIGEADASGRFYARLQHEPNVTFLLDSALIPKLKTTLEMIRLP